MTRVLIVAASPVVRAGLEALLSRSASLTVVGATSRSELLSESVDAGDPDVLLVEAESNGEPAPPAPSAVALWPRADAHPPAVVLLAESPDAAWTADALRAGVRAVLPREATSAEIVAAIEAAAAGLVVLRADLAAGLLPSAPRVAPRPPTGAQPLTRREVEILGMLAEGLGNKVIAARLGISEHTVKTHVASILSKLDAYTRAEAVAIGARLGLIML